MLYDLLKKCVSIFFNLFNKLLGGKLPPFGSSCVVVESHNHYLVIELPHNRVVFPGGFMNWRETPQQAAEREGREETGLILHADDLIGYYPCVSDKITNMSTISFVYHAEIVSGALQMNVEGQPRWIHEKELRPLLSTHSQRILDDYLRYRLQQKARTGALLSENSRQLVTSGRLS
jgi:ADP-ribose pyrophosphatase YjhB (NUDIX family)